MDDCCIVIAYINHESLVDLDLPSERIFTAVDHRYVPHKERLVQITRSASLASLPCLRRHSVEVARQHSGNNTPRSGDRANRSKLDVVQRGESDG